MESSLATPTPLSPARILMLEGQDAVNFAQLQFCGDVATLSDGAWQWNAWLDAQGRARCFFALLRLAPDRLLAWLPEGDAEAMRAALAMYLFRSKVRLNVLDGWTVYDASEAAGSPAAGQWLAMSEGFAITMPGPVRRIALLAPASARPHENAALDAWRCNDIAAGLPLLAAELGGMFVAQALDLARLGAVSFDKGCYPGQEIVARLHFRGGNKRRLCRLSIDRSAPPHPGETIHAEDATTPAGTVLYGASTISGACIALAVLPESLLASTALTTPSNMHINTCTLVYDET